MVPTATGYKKYNAMAVKKGSMAKIFHTADDRD